MSRIALALSLLLASPAAMACGMKKSHTVQLVDAFDAIDKAEDEVADAAAALADTLNSEAEATENGDAAAVVPEEGSEPEADTQPAQKSPSKK